MGGSMGTATSEAGRDESPVTAQEDPLGAGAVHAPIGEPLPHPEQRAIELASVLHALSDRWAIPAMCSVAALNDCFRKRSAVGDSASMSSAHTRTSSRRRSSGTT